VNITDGSNSTNVTYTFTTASGHPVVSDPVPADEASSVSVSLSQLSFNISDPQSSLMNYTVTISPDIGSDSQTDKSNGTYNVGVSGLIYNTTYTWWVNVTDGVLWTNKTYMFTTEAQPAPWWNTGWSYRREITIGHSKVDEDLTNFPVLISRVSDSDLASHAQSDGDDIAFTDYAGDQLAHEIEIYNSTSGELVAWVNVTSLSSSVDTVLYMYYGNLGCSNQENVAGTWDSGYVGVWHLSDTDDSSSNNHDGTNYGADNTSGKIGIGKDFVRIDADTGDYVDVADHDDFSISTTGNLTVETWVNFDDVGATRQGIVAKSSTSQWEWDYGHFSSSFNGFTMVDSGGGSIRLEKWPDGTPDRNTGVWYHVCSVYTGVTQNDDILIYVNGTEVSVLDSQAASTYSNTGAPFQFGRGYGASHWNYLDGQMDEIRVSNIQRNASWMKTCFENQINPSVFITVDSEEASIMPVVFNPSPANGATDVSLTLSELSFNLSHNQGDLMNYTVTTSPDIGSDSATGKGNGSYSVPVVGGLIYDTLYTWYVNVTDGDFWTNVTYSFTSVEFESPSFTATAYNRTVINLTSISGPAGADSIMIRYKEGVNTPWWNNAWNYKKQLNISNPISGYQMLLRVYKADGYDNPSNGFVDCEGHCNDDFSDLRFVNAAEDTLLPYWIENKTDGSHANVWVNTSGEGSVYLYYGNNGAVTAGDGDATFSFFEDFSGTESELLAGPSPLVLTHTFA